MLEAIKNVNVGAVTGYGEDEFTEKAKRAFEHHFGSDVGVHFVANGTAANVLAFGTVSSWFNSVLVSEVAHVNVDEGGAPERVFGLKTIPLASDDGKIKPDQVLKYTQRMGDVHHSQPRVVSITQPTEFGVVYSNREIADLSAAVHERGLLLHMDGARISNACASLGNSLRAGTRDLGVDFMSFGGTKNGIMMGEAVLFFTPHLDAPFRHIQKQTMQLLSKHRFVAAQMHALLTDDLWLQNAQNANQMTARLANVLQRFPRINFTHPTQANAIFATLPRAYIDHLLQDFYFYVWDESTNLVRLMCSFNTLPEHIEAFEAKLQEAQHIYG